MRLPAYIFALAILLSCKSKSSSNTELISDDFDNRQERVAKLRKEVIFFSDVIDAEFKLLNANGFHDQRVNVPGASFRNYKFAVRVNSSDISKWTAGMSDTNIAYTANLIGDITKLRQQNWIISEGSVPEFFVRKGEGVMMAVFKKEGIVWKWIVSD